MVNTLVEGLKERIANAVVSNKTVGIVLPSSNYDDLSNAIFEYIQSNPETPWIYIAITKPFHIIKKEYESLFNNVNIQFIDCVSRASGIQIKDSLCYFIDSPSQLESLILEIVNMVKLKQSIGESYIILDSLSSLIMYNDALLVSEFFTHLRNNLNLFNSHIVSLCIEEEMNDQMNKMLYLKNEKIIKVRESFI
jgi:hypothetical protein